MTTQIKCSIEDCENPQNARGWCKTHWKRWRKNGDPKIKTLWMQSDPEHRFWAKVSLPDTNGCLLWRKPSGSNGRGTFWNGKRPVQPYRFAYELLIGPIPPGLTIDHVWANGCRNPLCVNPNHLEVVSQCENVMRGRNAGKTHCPQGHPYDEANTYVTRKGTRACRSCHKSYLRTYRLKALRGGPGGRTSWA